MYLSMSEELVHRSTIYFDTNAWACRIKVVAGEVKEGKGGTLREQSTKLSQNFSTKRIHFFS